MIEYDHGDQILAFLLRSSHSEQKFIEGRRAPTPQQISRTLAVLGGHPRNFDLRPSLGFFPSCARATGPSKSMRSHFKHMPDSSELTYTCCRRWRLARREWG